MPRADQLGDLADRDRLAGADVVGRVSAGARLRRPPRSASEVGARRRRRRGRSRASGRRPRRPAAARRARARSGTSPPRRSTACPAASPARRRCGSAARPPPRRPAGPTRTCSAPGRPCWRRSCCAGRAARPRRPAPSRGRAPQLGQWLSKSPASSAATDARRRALVAVLGAGVAALAVDDHRRGEHQPAYAGLVHRGQQRGGAEVVVARRSRAGRPTCTPAPTTAAWWQTASTPRSRSPHASASRTSSRCVPAGGSPDAVRQRQHQVDPDDLVPVALERRADRGADEAGRPGEQDPHGIS